MKRHLPIVLAFLMMFGAGCWSKPITQPKPTPPPSECPDVCGAICAGKPEPIVPPGCAMPMCACDPMVK